MARKLTEPNRLLDAVTILLRCRHTDAMGASRYRGGRALASHRQTARLKPRWRLTSTRPAAQRYRRSGAPPKRPLRQPHDLDRARRLPGLDSAAPGFMSRRSQPESHQQLHPPSSISARIPPLPRLTLGFFLWRAVGVRCPTSPPATEHAAGPSRRPERGSNS
jgi:hypothetical protein